MMEIVAELILGKATILQNELLYIICGDPTYMKVYEIKTALLDKELRTLQAYQLTALWLETDDGKEFYENINNLQYEIYDIREYLYNQIDFYKNTGCSDKLFLELLDKLCSSKDEKSKHSGYKPDYGMQLMNDGVSEETIFHFYKFPLYELYLLSEGKFSTMVEMPYKGEPHALSLDFTEEQLYSILEQSKSKSAQYIRDELSRDRITTRVIQFEEPIFLDAETRLGKVEKNNKEIFVPLILTNFFPKRKNRYDDIQNASPEDNIKIRESSHENSIKSESPRKEEKSNEQQNKADRLNENEDNSIWKDWWRWLLLPLASVGGAYIAFFIFMMIQYIHPANTGGYLDYVTIYLIPIIGKGIFGFVFGFVSFALPPRGKLVTSTTMITLFTVITFLNIFATWYHQDHSFLAKIYVLSGDSIAVAGAIYGARKAYNDF